MARPQLEDGHTQIANEILEHLVKVHLSPNQWQVFLFIVRKTYGFHKKVDHIANLQIVAATGLCKAVVSRSLQKLESMNIITRNGKLMGVQKDWEHWRKLAESSTKPVTLQSVTVTHQNREVSSSVNNQKLAIPSTELAIPSTELAIPSTKVSSCAVAQKKKETIQKKLFKRKYGEFQNVLLTDEEYQKLQDRFGNQLSDKLETFSAGIESKGYKYKSHYAAILSWSRRDALKLKEDNGNGQRPTQHQRNTSIPGNRPAGAFANLENV